VLTLLLVAQLLSSETNPAAWPSHRGLADWLSTGAVATNIAMDTRASWTSPARARAFRCEAIRIGLAAGVAEATKRLVHRRRPDGSDTMSFFSEHTALAAASANGWTFGLGLTIGTGYGRLAANKHYTSDVIIGGMVGGLTHLACKAPATP
jgi:membrane-associated phospholipid phosphatase